MLKLNPNPTFKTKVAIPVPGAEAVPVEFEFKHFGKKAYDAWLAEVKKTKRPYLDAVLDISSGWSGVELESGANADFNRESVNALLEIYPGAGPAIVEAHGAALYGLKL